MDYIITDTLNPQVVLSEAREWLDQFYKERNLSPDKYPCVSLISSLSSFFDPQYTRYSPDRSGGRNKINWHIPADLR